MCPTEMREKGGKVYAFAASPFRSAVGKIDFPYKNLVRNCTYAYVHAFFLFRISIFLFRATFFLRAAQFRALFSDSRFLG